MGTAAAVAATSDPRLVGARGTRAADQINPEPPEERRSSPESGQPGNRTSVSARTGRSGSAGRGPVEPAAGRKQEDRDRPRRAAEPARAGRWRSRRVVPRGRRRRASSLRRSRPGWPGGPAPRGSRRMRRPAGGRTMSDAQQSPDAPGALGASGAPGARRPAGPGRAWQRDHSAASGRAAEPGRQGDLPFPDLPPVPDLPAIEHEMLQRWRDGKVFQRSLEQTAGGPQWTFYAGPVTANGLPGVHHVEPRALKDVFPRFKTMQGFHVPRQGGWDCHGLPVEVAVEKELGLSGKKEIESYGVAEFNARCRESVLRHMDAHEALIERMGHWIDLSRAYRTMDPSYVESVWWSLKVIYDKGLLVRDFRISPYCPRCGTVLSDHEMGQPDVYQLVADPSVTVRFAVETVPAGA